MPNCLLLTITILYYEIKKIGKSRRNVQMDAAGFIVGGILYSPGVEADIPVDTPANKRIFWRGQFGKDGGGDDGVRVYLRYNRIVRGLGKRFSTQKMDDSIRGAHFLHRHFPVWICREHWAYDFYIRRVKRVGAGVLLSAGLFAARPAF